MFYYEPGTVEDAKEIAVKKGAKKPCPHGAYTLVKLTPFTILGKIFNFQGFISSFGKSLFAAYSMPGNGNIMAKETYYILSVFLGLKMG